MYTNELKAIKKSGRFRERKIFDEKLQDFASNDYLGLSTNKKQFEKAVKLVQKYNTKSPKASMLINGYHPIHKRFEEFLAKQNDFESGIVMGSGYLANMALMDALVRKGDMLFMDEEYHASGIMASELIANRVVMFKHNDSQDLAQKLQKHPAKRQIVAVEGIYSMSGDLCPREIFDISEQFKAMMIVDEAHSAGVIGKNLLGIFDYYGIVINRRHIKMGTLGKAYGSYGAYILSSQVVSDFLVNRARPIIYTTAPSIVDTALAYVNARYIQKNKKELTKKIKSRQKIVYKMLGVKISSLILPLKAKSNQDALSIQQSMIDDGYLIGAIRKPTVRYPIVRIIPNIANSKKSLKSLLTVLKFNKIGEVSALSCN